MRGRSLLWGSRNLFVGQIGLEANAKDGHGVDWPIVQRIDLGFNLCGENLQESQVKL